MAKSAVNHNHLDSARTEFELGMILSWRAANAAPALEWCWVTPGEQSRVISRECRRTSATIGLPAISTTVKWK